MKGGQRAAGKGTANRNSQHTVQSGHTRATNVLALLWRRRVAEHMNTTFRYML